MSIESTREREDEPGRRRWAAVSWVLAGLLPLVGFASLLLRSRLDPHLENHKLHFVVFVSVGVLVFALAYGAQEAADKRGDARVLLISLAFLATGGFLALHALGTPGILVSRQFSGFEVAIPVGLLVAALFALASALVDCNPALPPLVIRRRSQLRGLVIATMAAWAIWTIAKLPPLDRPSSEGASGSLLATFAALGVLSYGASAARYWLAFRRRMSPLPVSVIGCFVLLAEAMIGVAVTGERNWHASWWEWHGLIVAAYVIVGLAARHEWREERFRHLYLPSTRERRQDVSVLFSDLAEFTRFSERSSPAEVAELLSTYYALAAPLISRQFGGEVEMFAGDGMMATFNSRGDQADHALRASGAALALQHKLGSVADQHPGWPRLRVGVNTGEAVLRELGGHGHVTYALLGDTINAASRLEGQAPVGSVLIGAETYRRLPSGAVVEAMGTFQVKGKRKLLEAYVLHALPAAGGAAARGSRWRAPAPPPASARSHGGFARRPRRSARAARASPR
jgi:class 3 adenylate cyclase